MIDGFFRLSLNGTNVRTEIIAGATTYLTMAYIVFVNPVILALGFISYVAVKLLSVRFAEAGPSMTVLAVLFVVKYAFF